MKLPIRLSSATELIEQYSHIIDAYVDNIDLNSQQSRLESTLNQLYDKCVTVSENMLRALGYNGSLKKMEQELNDNIKNLQTGTSYLNGEELVNFIYDQLKDAIPADPQYQEYFNQFIDKLIAKGIIQDKSIEAITIGVNEFFGHEFTDGVEVEITDGVGKIKDRDILGRFTRTISENFYKNGQALQKEFKSHIGSSEANYIIKGKNTSVKLTKLEDGVQLTFDPGLIDQDTLANFLRVTPSFVTKFPDVRNKVNEVMTKKILSSYTGKDKDLFEECIKTVITEKPTAFFVGNNVQNITGILGEIQALYYIRSIIKTNNKVDEASVSWIGGKKNPHADLLLEYSGKQYGIQVKNTTLNEAELEVAFENFKSNLNTYMDQGRLKVDWLKEQSTKYSGVIVEQQNQQLFEAATQFLGMEMFNIPYKWTNGEAIEVAEARDVPKFTSTRQLILEEANKARKAMMTFAAGMMYMQLTDLVPNKGHSSTLYIIGGKLAITSATILQKIISNLKQGIASFNTYIDTQLRSLRKGETKEDKKKMTKINTIVNFLNAEHGHHRGDTRYVLESSFTFTF